jgi:hypothetical protein
VEWGWLIRYMHSTGASAFFIVIYLHMFRGLMYGSYKNPRELVWIFGMLIYLALMAEAFFGYLLPWGNMSYWGAQVIVSLFGAIPGALLAFILFRLDPPAPRKVYSWEREEDEEDDPVIGDLWKRRRPSQARQPDEEDEGVPIEGDDEEQRW